MKTSWAGSARSALSLGIPPLLAVVCLFSFLPGCSEWDKYWEEDDALVGPGPATDTTPPVVSLASPTGPDSTRATPVSGDYQIVINAFDSVGVVRVVLHVDGVPVRELLSPPWEFSWDTTGLDEASYHRLSATADDAAGNVGTSEPAFAQVFNEGPEIVLTTPDDGSLVLGTIEILAEFPNETPDISQVEFLADVWTIETVTSPPWKVDYDTRTAPGGEHFLAAKVTTVLGSVGVSPAVRIHVNNGTPTMAIEFPLRGHRIAPRGTLVLIGTATDEEEGVIPPDRVWWSSDVQGSLGPGHELWATTDFAPGTHVITATATNAWGTAGSDAVEIEVLTAPTYTYCADIQWDLLEEYFCTFCHQLGSSEYPSSELDLRNHELLMKGGKTPLFKCVYPCRPESSFIYNKITAYPPETPWIGEPMPRPGTGNFPQVRPAVQEQLRIWILEGAPPDVSEDCF